MTAKQRSRSMLTSQRQDRDHCICSTDSIRMMRVADYNLYPIAKALECFLSIDGPPRRVVACLSVIVPKT